jgi:hypothetical protein
MPLLVRALEELKSLITDKKSIKSWEDKSKMLIKAYSSYFASLDHSDGYCSNYRDFIKQLEHNPSRFALHP